MQALTRADFSMKCRSLKLNMLLQILLVMMTLATLRGTSMHDACTLVKKSYEQGLNYTLEVCASLFCFFLPLASLVLVEI